MNDSDAACSASFGAGLAPLALVVVLGCSGSAGCSKKPAAGKPPTPRGSAQMKAKTPAQSTECRTGKDLASVDGQKVRLIGVYRKSMTARKMRGPKKFRGYVEIELNGQASDYDSKAGPGKPVIELVGKRPDEEVQRLTDRRVRVDGVLRLDPYKEVREAKVSYATVIYGPPQLENAHDLALAD